LQLPAASASAADSVDLVPAVQVAAVPDAAALAAHRELAALPLPFLVVPARLLLVLPPELQLEQDNAETREYRRYLRDPQLLPFCRDSTFMCSMAKR
jgi:hypothetical protein